MTAAYAGIPNWRPTEHRVWRGSYDESDERAQVAMPIGAEAHDTLAFIDFYLLGLKKWANETKQRGRAHSISHNMIAVAEVLLRRCTDFKDGRCTPSISTIMEKTGFAKPTVISLLARLREHGLLDWVRRTIRTGDTRRPVEQTSNAYLIDFARLPKQIALYLRQKLRDRIDIDAQPRRKGSPPLPPFAERMVQKLVRKASSAFSAGRRQDRERIGLAAQIRATSDPAAKAQLMWPASEADQQEFVQAHAHRQWSPKASSEPSPECHPKDKNQKE